MSCASSDNAWTLPSAPAHATTDPVPRAAVTAWELDAEAETVSFVTRTPSASDVHVGGAPPAPPEPLLELELPVLELLELLELELPVLELLELELLLVLELPELELPELELLVPPVLPVFPVPPLPPDASPPAPPADVSERVPMQPVAQAVAQRSENDASFHMRR